jgi:hypothetical protein
MEICRNMSEFWWTVYNNKILPLAHLFVVLYALFINAGEMNNIKERENYVIMSFLIFIKGLDWLWFPSSYLYLSI